MRGSENSLISVGLGGVGGRGTDVPGCDQLMVGELAISFRGGYRVLVAVGSVKPANDGGQ